MPTARLRGGWYRVVAVYSKEDYSFPKLWLPSGEYPHVLNGGEHWYGIRYPDPEKGGIIYVRLEQLAMAAEPCRCPVLRFPHKRSKNCKGDPRGKE